MSASPGPVLSAQAVLTSAGRSHFARSMSLRHVFLPRILCSAAESGIPNWQSVAKDRPKVHEVRRVLVCPSRTLRQCNLRRGSESSSFATRASHSVSAHSLSEDSCQESVHFSPTASDVVIAFYDAINARDVDRAMRHIADDCVYEDMIYSRPFEGGEAIRQHFQNVVTIVPSDFLFIIDKITSGDAPCVGMTWHAETQGKSFPFSRGCSFYECSERNGHLQIVFARDVVEPSSKPGAAALVVLKYIARLLKTFPAIQDKLAS